MGLIKRTCGCLLAILLIGVCFIAFVFSTCDKKSYQEVFLINWEITLPENMKKEFSKSEDNWGGGGIRYAVFKLEKKPAELIEDFSRENSEDMESAVDKYLADAYFKISKTFLPKWEEKYYWKHIEKKSSKYDATHHCYMIFFPDSLRLKICQYFF